MAVSPEQLLDRFAELPPEAQREAVHFLDFLKSRYKTVINESEEKPLLDDEAFIGMWCNRDDLNDSSEWVRDLRQKDWS